MKINHIPDRNRWRVSYQVNGQQKRPSFATKAEAEQFVASRLDDAKQFGIAWPTRSPLERMAMETELARLKRGGFTLRAAVDLILEHGKAPTALPLAAVAAQCLRAKEAKGCRPRTLRKLRTTLDKFLICRRSRPACEITSAEINEFLTRNGWRPATMRSVLTDLQTLFAFAVRNRFCRENPALAVEKPRLDNKPPGILTPPQCAALLRQCQEVEPTLLATLALCLCLGIRPEEARRLSWETVLPDHVDIEADKSKTRRRRLVTITPQARAWLDLSRALESELPVANYASKFNRVRRLAGLFKNWPQNAMRHSFASYHFAFHRDERKTAYEMGHSPQMLFAHYRERVRPVDAEAFFAILPGDVAAPGAAALPGETVTAKGNALPLAKTAKPAPRGRKVTAELLGAMFQHGARTLTKQEAVALLCDEHRFTPSTAYLALSATGRFRAHLRERGGKLTWNPFPQAEAAETPAPMPAAGADAPDSARVAA